MHSFRYAQTHLQLDAKLRERGAPESERVAVARAHELATRLFAGQFRSSGKPFLCHLVGTASILDAHGAPPPVVLAGLLHAAYDHGEFGTGRPGATLAKRRRVREAIGGPAEAVVEAYASVHWSTWEKGEVAGRLASLAPEQRLASLVASANELEEGLDLALAWSGEARRAAGLAALELAAELAEAQGLGELAAELRECSDETRRARLPAALRTGREASYTLHSLTALQRLRVAFRHRAERMLGLVAGRAAALRRVGAGLAARGAGVGRRRR